MAVIHLLPPIEDAIWKAADAPPRPKRKPGKHGSARGPQPAKNRVPDEIIIAMRRMHEKEGKSYRQVEAAYPYMRARYVRDVLEYIIRRTLRP